MFFSLVSCRPRPYRVVSTTTNDLTYRRQVQICLLVSDSSIPVECADHCAPSMSGRGASVGFSAVVQRSIGPRPSTLSFPIC